MLRQVSAMQEDVFLPNLTAWESLSFYARLSLPADITRLERRARMENILETMGIANVRFSMVKPDGACSALRIHVF